jgi:DNA-binding NtrC family response regulator
MPMRVWLRNFGESAGREVTEVTTALRRSDIEVDLTVADATGPGIVILAGVSEPVCRFLRLVAENARVRTLCLVRAAAAGGGGGVPEAWRLLRAGAADVLAWMPGADIGALVAARLDRWQAIDELAQDLAREGRLVGSSLRWRTVLRAVIEAARFTDANVLLTGESGTGKELVARLIHDLDPRPGKERLIVLDCTTVVPELSGSEFFGHEKGPSPAPSPSARAPSPSPTAAPCSWTRSATCRWRCRRSSCA